MVGIIESELTMALTITRQADVYRLWLDEDLRQCFDAHAQLGWLCTLVAAAENGVTVWGVRMQLNGSKLPVVAATLDDVIVSDGSTIEVLTLADFNKANPGNKITKGK